MEDWVKEESCFEGAEGGIGYAQSYKVTKKLYDEHTKYQHLQVYETAHFGNLMVLDGVFQNSEADEFSYHEMQAHVPLLAHPCPKKVLIIGGGDGGVAREVLKHKIVEEVTLVDIDEKVTEVAKKFFQKLASAFSDSRLTVLHEDGAAFVKRAENKNRYDVICIDSSDPIGPNAVLFRKPFYQDVHSCLKEGGLAVAQAECMWLHPKTVKSVMEMNREIFKRVDYYWHLIPIYPCGVMGLLALSKDDRDMSQITRLQEAEKISSDCLYYNPGIHAAAFAKPNFLARHQDVLRP